MQGFLLSLFGPEAQAKFNEVIKDLGSFYYQNEGEVNLVT